jgi:uncharacterized repeat protein (TIGR01451 family)
MEGGKMKKRVLFSIMVLALVAGIAVMMAMPATADPAAVSMSKESVQHPGDPVHPADVYLIGMEVHYDMTITNTSSTLNLIIKIQDRVPVNVTTSPPSPMPGTTTWWWNDITKDWVLTDPDTPVTLTPGQSWTQDFHHIIQASDLVPHPTIPEVNIMTNQLLATGSQGIEVVNVNVTKTVQVVQPEISVTKMADTDVSKAGDTINYTITIENTGDWPLGNITVVDNVLGDLSDKFVDTLAPGASDTQVIPYIVHEGDPDPLTNTVTATGVAQGFDATIPGATVSDSATESVDLVEPCINIFKEANVEFSKVGDTINYTITVSNCGDVELVNIQVTDTLAAESPWVIPSILPGQNEVINFAYVVQEGDPDPLVNTATATGYLQDMPNVIGPKQTSVEVDLVTPGISITKACSPSSGTVGDTITYTITIANTGDVALENVTVSDSLLGDLSASFVDYLAVGASDTHTFYRDIQSGDPSPLVNTATVNATVIELGNPVSDEDSCEVTIEIAPDTVTTLDASATMVPSGGSVDLTVTEENTGDVDLTNPYVEVWKDGALFATLTAPPDSGDVANPGVLNVGELWSWTIDSGAITVPTHFVALGFGTDPLGNLISYDTGYLGERDEVRVVPEPVVGGEAYPANKLPILALGAALLVAVITGASLVAQRRHRA